jgi:hypothetical protein
MNKAPFDPIDALEKKVVIGNVYGYSINSNGWSKTVVGKAVGLTKTGLVKLEVIKVCSFLYGRPTNREWDKLTKHVNIRPHMIFPVN